MSKNALQESYAQLVKQTDAPTIKVIHNYCGLVLWQPVPMNDVTKLALVFKIAPIFVQVCPIFKVF